jgi:hypothetical protein
MDELLIDRFKYPRTPHLPWSRGRSADDKQILNFDGFEGREVVITEKMDGENTTLYPDTYTHARSIDSKYHESRTWIKSDWASKAHRLAPNLRIAGENMFARHSIAYNDLESYFYGYGVYAGNRCLSWDETVDLIQDFDYPTPYEYYRGMWNQAVAHQWSEHLHEIRSEDIEGYVVRITDEFDIADFGSVVAKSVRHEHVNTDAHWMHSRIIPNGLKENS